MICFSFLWILIAFGNYGSVFCATTCTTGGSKYVVDTTIKITNTLLVIVSSGSTTPAATALGAVAQAHAGNSEEGADTRSTVAQS